METKTPTIRYKRRRHNVTCKFCNAPGLRWSKKGNGFALYERDENNQLKEHTCPWKQ